MFFLREQLLHPAYGFIYIGAMRMRTLSAQWKRENTPLSTPSLYPRRSRKVESLFLSCIAQCVSLAHTTYSAFHRECSWLHCRRCPHDLHQH